ncbi:MAG: hypothetical protein NTZ35_12930 [Ignavibacteriales bacterium]|nr:hypothetical protein [Ignavibacteriales bacterium]
MNTQTFSETMVREPIFSRQEQGVVYLFSRYWGKIDIFKNKRICNIHTHFPDFSVEDIHTEEEEGIEFEYGLSDFQFHLYGDLKKLKDDGIRLLYIVCWDENYDRGDMRRRIRKHFTGKVIFLCLSKYFSPCVERDSNSLRASWVFSVSKQIKETYSFAQIEKDTKKLKDQGAFVMREMREPKNGLYRTIGFNKGNFEFIECDHWKAIHFFTTSTPFHEDNIPSKLLVKPSGYQSFSGYFDIKYAFVIKKGGKPVKKYFTDYYFYPYEPGYKDSTCFVYSRFKEFSFEQGIELFRYLKSKYALDVRGSRVIENAEHIRGINGIVR